MKWEYLIVRRISFKKRVSWLVNDESDDTLEECRETEVLNKVGKAGWELTAVDSLLLDDTDEEANLDIVPTGGTNYYLKRPLP